MRLTLTVLGRTSTIELWQKPAQQHGPAQVTPEQREELFREWERQRSSAGGGTNLMQAPRSAASSTNRSRRTVGFDLDTTDNE